MSQRVDETIASIERAVAEALSPLTPEERREVCERFARALNVYITAAKFENPPKFKVPAYIEPYLTEPTPAPPRNP